jgi:hypothetical protein
MPVMTHEAPAAVQELTSARYAIQTQRYKATIPALAIQGFT